MITEPQFFSDCVSLPLPKFSSESLVRYRASHGLFYRSYINNIRFHFNECRYYYELMEDLGNWYSELDLSLVLPPSHLKYFSGRAPDLIEFE
jgi:hypothetical protein